MIRLRRIRLIAVVRRVLIVTAEGKRSALKGDEFTNLLLELGVLTALVVALAVALYFLRPHQRNRTPERSGAARGDAAGESP